MIEIILDQCLDEIRAHRASIDDCLLRYPDYAAELRPLLETALAIEQIPEIKTSEEFKRATRRLLFRDPKSAALPSDDPLSKAVAPPDDGAVSGDGPPSIDGDPAMDGRTSDRSKPNGFSISIKPKSDD